MYVACHAGSLCCSTAAHKNYHGSSYALVTVVLENIALCDSPSFFCFHTQKQEGIVSEVM